MLAAENVEETLPLPEDFTGDGELFMLRVRGDSMIDAGIFDGDYVVVRQQPDADNGDIVVAGIPGEEATVKTFLRRRGKIVLRPGEPDDGRDGVRPRRRHDLRQGRHAAAPPLSPDGTRRAPRRTARSVDPAFDELAGGVRELGIARDRSCTPGCRASAKRATSVQPSFGRTGEAVRRRSARRRADA